jgi:alginate O-acetyltransferase complex protein AlgI
MGLIGLWHGAGWGFVLWGLYHGLLLNGFAWAKRRKIAIEGHMILLLCVLIGWALFLSPTLGFAGQLFSNMFGLHGIGSLEQLTTIYSTLSLVTLILGLILTFMGRVEAVNIPRRNHPGYAFAWGILTVLCLIHLGTASEFIYIQF